MIKPKLHIIGTGGTIAGVTRAGAASSTQKLQAYNAGVLTVDALLHDLKLGNLRERFHITSEQLVNIDSKDMNPEVWWRLAQRLHALAQDTQVQGVVITHGTDTLEETGYFIEQLKLSGAFDRADKSTAQMAIVFTAAMRPADAPDADGPQNLTDALMVAADARANKQGVLCVLQGRIHSALHINKAHSTALDAFNSLPHEAMGAMHDGKAVFTSASLSAALSTHYTQLVAALEKSLAIAWPWVALVTSHAGIDARVISGLVDAGVKGIIIAATGNGTISNTLLEPLRDAVRKGIVVRRASRVWQGGVHAYAHDEFESAGELSAIKARVKLMIDIAVRQ